MNPITIILSVIAFSVLMFAWVHFLLTQLKTIKKYPYIEEVDDALNIINDILVLCKLHPLAIPIFLLCLILVSVPLIYVNISLTIDVIKLKGLNE